MNAVASRVETKVIAEDRIARIESDVAEIKDDVKTVNVRLSESIAANAREFGAVRGEFEKGINGLRLELATHRTETEKGFGTVRAESEKGFGGLRSELEKHGTETEKRFGALRVAIESNKTETEKGFGGLRVEIEKNRTEIQAIRTAIESAKFWIVGTAIGTVVTLLGGLHILKII